MLPKNDDDEDEDELQESALLLYEKVVLDYLDEKFPEWSDDEVATWAEPLMEALAEKFVLVPRQGPLGEAIVLRMVFAGIQEADTRKFFEDMTGLAKLDVDKRLEIYQESALKIFERCIKAAGKRLGE